MVGGQIASKAQGIRYGADTADLSRRPEGTTFSTDAVFLAALHVALHAALLAEPFTAYTAEPNTDFMADAVRLPPSI